MNANVCVFHVMRKWSLEETVKKKVMSMYTDPNHIRVDDPGLRTCRLQIRM